MYVCHCRAVTDRDVVAAIENGARDEAAVGAACGAGVTCGGCLPLICALLGEHGNERCAAATAGRLPERVAS